MKAFIFPPAAYAEHYVKHGYVHIKNGVDPEFLLFAREQLDKCRSVGYNELPSRAIANKKKQYLFDLPDEFLPSFINTISVITGWPREQITLSERHIMIYEDKARAVPQLHKDRFASQISIGIPLEHCSDARIALVTDASAEPNLLNRATYASVPSIFQSRLLSNRQMEVEPIDEESPPQGMQFTQLDAQPGDVVMFAGSYLYHGRLNAAHSAVLYFKANCMRLDPLGEDPSTLAQRATSLEILKAAGEPTLLYATVELSPRLQGVTCNYTRLNWTPLLYADIAEQEPVPISDAELRFLFGLRNRQTVADVFSSLGVPKENFAGELSRVCRLAACGIIDVVAMPDALE